METSVALARATLELAVRRAGQLAVKEVSTAARAAAASHARRLFRSLDGSPRWRRLRALATFIEHGEVHDLLMVVGDVPGDDVLAWRATGMFELYEECAAEKARELVRPEVSVDEAMSWAAGEASTIAEAAYLIDDYRRSRRRDSQVRALLHGLDVDESPEARIASRLNPAEQFMFMRHAVTPRGDGRRSEFEYRELERLRLRARRHIRSLSHPPRQVVSE